MSGNLSCTSVLRSKSLDLQNAFKRQKKPNRPKFANWSQRCIPYDIEIHVARYSMCLTKIGHLKKNVLLISPLDPTELLPTPKSATWKSIFYSLSHQKICIPSLKIILDHLLPNKMFRPNL